MFWQLTVVFLNGLTGQLVVCRVGLDINYVIETVPVPLRRMEDKIVKVGNSQKDKHVWWKLADCRVTKEKLLSFLLLWLLFAS